MQKKENRFPTLERRRPREYFTKALTRICERLNKQSEFHLKQKGTGALRGLDSEGLHAITQVWVVGSYARGVDACGDLDLLCEIRLLDGGRQVYPKTVFHAAFGSPPDVRCYEGTPENNGSGVVFEDAVLIWSKAGHDWKAAIASIKPAPNAKRFARTKDAIPLRMEQIQGSPEYVDGIVEHHAKGLLDWSFVAFSELPEGNPSVLDQVTGLIDFRWGKKSKEMAPYIGRYLERREFGIENAASWRSSEIEAAGVRLRVGPSYIPIDALDEIMTSRVVIVPHLSLRGPNGIWEIRRGPNHPLEIAFREVNLFVVMDRGSPHAEIYSSANLEFNAVVLDLFTNEDAASEFIKEVESSNEIQKAGACITLHRLNGTHLLDLVSQADVIQVDGDSMALSYSGAQVLNEWVGEKRPIATTEEICKLMGAQVTRHQPEPDASNLRGP